MAVYNTALLYVPWLRKSSSVLLKKDSPCCWKFSASRNMGKHMGKWIWQVEKREPQFHTFWRGYDDTFLFSSPAGGHGGTRELRKLKILGFNSHWFSEGRLWLESYFRRCLFNKRRIVTFQRGEIKREREQRCSDCWMPQEGGGREAGLSARLHQELLQWFHCIWPTACNNWQKCPQI